MPPRILTMALILLAPGLFGLGGRSGARPVCDTEPGAVPREVTSSLPCRKKNLRVLAFLGHAEVPAVARFAAEDHFREERRPQNVPITWIGANFHRHFIHKIEGYVSAGELDVYELRRSAGNDAIIDDIGGQLETKLHDLWVLLERQAHGQDGPLRTDARPNVFYVRDVQNVLWAVDVVWGGAGWEIGASPLDDRRLWDAPVNVIAR